MKTVKGDADRVLKYDNYLTTVASRFESRLDEISATYNFDYGSEFEVALCKTLRLALPARYGVCRGFLVDVTGKKVGDDIIIYDHERFPALRMLDDEDFLRRESIPIEAAYAYIEAKHTLTVDGGCPTFPKALEQVAKAKALVATRTPVTEATLLDPYLNLPHVIGTMEPREGWPCYFNPFFSGIISRRLEDNAAAALIGLQYDKATAPDLVVAGADRVCMPMLVREGRRKVLESPFMLTESTLCVYEVPGLAFAIGFSNLMLALDMTRLGRMPWHAMIGDALGLKEKN